MGTGIHTKAWGPGTIAPEAVAINKGLASEVSFLQLYHVIFSKRKETMNHPSKQNQRLNNYTPFK